MWYVNRDDLDLIALAGRQMMDVDGTPVYRMNGNFWLACEPNDTAFTPSARDAGTWEAWVTTAISQELIPADKRYMFIDVGANVGYYSFMAQRLGARVVSFEPNQELKKYWEISRICNNRMSSDPYVKWLAVGDVPEMKMSFVHENHTGALSFYEGDTQGQEYPITTLDNELFPEDRFKGLVFKVDVEGFEREAWEGAKRLREYPNNVWFIEWVPVRHGIAYNREWLEEVLLTHDLQMVHTDGHCYPVGVEEALQVEFETIVFRKR